jgi:peptidyl-prolyl cis-trans isomerase-like protein 2
MADPTFLDLEDDQALNPLKGINVDAAGGAGKVLRMVAEKVRQDPSATSISQLIVPPPVVEAGGFTANRKERHHARG